MAQQVWRAEWPPSAPNPYPHMCSPLILNTDSYLKLLFGSTLWQYVWEHGFIAPGIKEHFSDMLVIMASILLFEGEGTKPPLFWGRVAKFCISAGKTWSRVGQRPEALSLSKLLLPSEGHYLGRLMVMQAQRWIQRVNVTRALTFLWNKCFHSCVCKGSLLIPWLWPSVCFLRSSPNNFCICSSDSGDIASVFSPS